MRKKLQRGLSALLSLCLVGAMLVNNPVEVFAAAAKSNVEKNDGRLVVNMKADETTTVPNNGTLGVTGGFGTEASDGRIWTDKSVVVNDTNDNFEVTLSALAQQYESSRANAANGSGGGSSVAADVTFILDMSSSMDKNDVTFSGGKYTRVEAMVRATNHAIAIIMEANPQ
ncbi:hypothetical protein LJC58_08585, partial [Lachnospiraceae bacterium OttesenSCG-928-D06]|nr:hypothetical protein [Lachnospiraceae bacterium OttesenSCG-928-D06]